MTRLRHAKHPCPPLRAALCALMLLACDESVGPAASALPMPNAGAQALAPVAQVPSDWDPALARVEEGVLRGSLQLGTVRTFLGIPYARAPLADRRWRAPEPHPPWTGIREVLQFGARCPQAASHGLADEAVESEDCLYLNVWAPLAAARAPVMVWIHGGGNRDGTASDDGTSGKYLSLRHGVVVVSLNYRLGALGFFAHPELRAEGSKPGNQGLWDQQLALSWVKRNIAAFGGDPGNVTIFGESAGSLDVCLHVAAPASRGLFQRAISESGGCTTRRTLLAEAEARVLAWAERAGCSAPDVLACLRRKPVAELFAAADALAAEGVSFGPVVDGDFTPEQPRALYDQHDIAQVPYLLGSNTDEGTAFTLNAPAISDERQYLAALAQRFEAAPEAVAALYPASAFATAKEPYRAALARAWGDARLVCPTFDVALRAASAGLPVFLYNFDMPMDGAAGIWGAAHAWEIGYVFGTGLFPEPDRAVSERMQHYWTQFAATGDPSMPELLTWPRFSETHDVRVNFARESTLVTGFRARECEFWRAEYDRTF